MRSASVLLKYELECLRLASDCWQLAGDAPSPAWRSHFARMAEVWQARAVRNAELLIKRDGHI